MHLTKKQDQTRRFRNRIKRIFSPPKPKQVSPGPRSPLEEIIIELPPDLLINGANFVLEGTIIDGEPCLRVLNMTSK